MGARESDECDLRWWGLTDKGPFRKNNEDAFLALTFDENEVRLLGKEGEADFSLGDFVFAVSDGMGGARAGEFASRIAVQKITERFPKKFRTEAIQQPGGHEAALERLTGYIHAEMRVMGMHYEECSGMGATLSLLWLTPGKGYFCHVGDSRIYHLTADGSMTQLTEDHTHVGWLLREGKMNEREARFHEGRHMLQMALGGSTTNLNPHIGSVDISPGDSFVLCTDGLIEGLWDNTIRRLMKEPPPLLAGLPPAQRLLSEALSESGRDNTTVIVLQL
ncbi:serine/threonine-protein phosphatase [Puniceicoccales bacterium CK1056]|uniref:Serine/threonine-protein phosphatase n=1 Tax=Oceanipulchritudo coccoides TaxID=2706888 RepID=A0A6B2M0Z9_9BACT|nr:protein phosphatase 2C domain-containing protein [Oceanipulchritudo coccoides]NDV61400.1 serine/threonine-protein phosphatase [Oceanipulchritudo coccoides]